MTTHDRQDFAELMLGIGEAYGEPVSDVRMEIYFAGLSDLTLDAIRVAANVHVRTQKFFPRVSELREAVQGSADDRADIAWVGLLRIVRKVGYVGAPAWPDPVMRRAAMELYGSWVALCQRLPSEGPELLGAAKLFKATYAAYARLDLRGDLPELPSKDEARGRLVDLRSELTKRGLSAPCLPNA